MVLWPRRQRRRAWWWARWGIWEHFVAGVATFLWPVGAILFGWCMRGFDCHLAWALAVGLLAGLFGALLGWGEWVGFSESRF